MVDGVVLAAGASVRMGTPKPLLEIDGTTFIERSVHVLREGGCRYVVAVVNDDDWIERLVDVSGAAVVVNDQDDTEQIDSLRLGIANLPDDSDGVLVLPVDFPRVTAETVRALIEAFERSPAPVLNPAYEGVAGHPVLFARAVLTELMQPHLPDGARSVIARHQRAARVVNVDDAGVVADVDTREDYERIVKQS